LAVAVDVAVGVARGVAVAAGAAVGRRGVGDGINVDVAVGAGVGSTWGFHTAVAHSQTLAAPNRTSKVVPSIHRRAV
jgi:hypothetical protein